MQTIISTCSRRHFVKGIAFGAAAFMVPGVFAEELVRTPRQTEGPFYPDKLPLDTDNFQGFGRFLTGSSGEYYFRTIKPVPYPGRTPHIHFKIKRGNKELLTTQCYIKGEQRNQQDGILRSIRDAKARESVIVDFAPVKGSRIGELAARFDVVLGITPEA